MNDNEQLASPVTVTIAIPTLNRVAYLKLAIDSALSQTYKHVEVLVSNNCSTDDTKSYLASIDDPRLKVLEQKTFLSMVANWNACVASASGAFFLLLSDDDVLEPNAIEQLLKPYLQAPTSDLLGFVYGAAEVIDGSGKSLWPVALGPSVEDANDLILGGFRGRRNVLLCSILFRTIDISTGFPDGFNIVNDAAMWMTVMVKYRQAVFIPVQLVKYRIHTTNLSFAASGDVWLREISTLAETVIREGKRCGRISKAFESRLRRAARWHAIGAIAANINKGYAFNRIKGLRAYAERIRFFASFAGLFILIRGVLGLFLPQATKYYLSRFVAFRSGRA